MKAPVTDGSRLHPQLQDTPAPPGNSPSQGEGRGWDPPLAPLSEGALTHFRLLRFLTNFSRFPPLLSSPLPLSQIFSFPSTTTSFYVPAKGLGNAAADVRHLVPSIRHMSNWNAALDLGGLDIDSAFRDAVFAQLRESFGRMVCALSSSVARWLWTPY